MAGTSGYLGKIISQKLESEGHNISAIGRDLLYGKINDLAEYLAGADVVINVAGSPILKRWTEKNKKIICESRILTSKNIVNAIQQIDKIHRPERIISASATGIYRNGYTHSEKSTKTENNFIGKLVKHWEASWNGLPEGTGLVIFRISPVLGSDAVIIKKLVPVFKMGIGGKIGSGSQPFPFIHEKDLARAFSFILNNPEKNGIYNLSAPQQINNSYFTKTLAKKLRRPAFIPIPPFLLKLLYGKAAGLLTESPAVIPEALRSAGFKFNYPTIEEVLDNSLI